MKRVGPDAPLPSSPSPFSAPRILDCAVAHDPVRFSRQACLVLLLEGWGRLRVTMPADRRSRPYVEWLKNGVHRISLFVPSEGDVRIEFRNPMGTARRSAAISAPQSVLRTDSLPRAAAALPTLVTPRLSLLRLPPPSAIDMQFRVHAIVGGSRSIAPLSPRMSSARLRPTHLPQMPALSRTMLVPSIPRECVELGEVITGWTKPR